MRLTAVRGAARALAALVALAAAAARAGAQEVNAGWEGDAAQGFAYVAPGVPIHLGGPHALLLGLCASYLYYGFDGDSGRVRVTSPGVAAEIGYQLDADRWYLAAQLGVETRQISMHPAEAAAAGTSESAWTTELEADFRATPRTTLTLMLERSASVDYTWSRARWERALTAPDSRSGAQVAAGIEATAESDQDEHDWQGGGVVALRLPGAGVKFRLHAGLGLIAYGDGTREVRPYFGVGASRAF